MEFDDNLNPIDPKPQGTQPGYPPTPPGQPPVQSPPPAPTPPPQPPRPLRGSSFAIIFMGILILILLGVGAFYLFANNSPRGGGPINGQPEGLNVSAEGLVYATPDIARLHAGISATGRDAATVQEDLSRRTATIKAKLKELAIEDKDIKTSEFGIYPDYGNIPQPVTTPPRTYTGRHILEITIRDLTKANAVADGVVAAGANEVQNIYFTVEDSDSWYQEARKQAIAKAKEKARQLADEAEIRLGKLISINESGGGPIYYDRAVPGYGGATDTKISLEPGNLEIRAYVTLIYAIR